MNTLLQRMQSLPEERRHLLVKVILVIAAIVVFFLLSLAITTSIDNASKPATLSQTTDTNTTPNINGASPSEVGLFASLGGFKKFFINEDTLAREQNGFSNLGKFAKELGASIKNGGAKVIDYMVQHWFTKTIN